MDLGRKREVNARREHWKTLAREAGYQPGKLAELCRISTRQLQRYFQEDSGCTPGEWLREQRMIAACDLLLSRESIKEVAFELGYKQVSHFCNDFKGEHGMTAVQFIENSASSNE